ncbi:MAG TPA: hypothetical protein VIL74_05565 [Pyrinomonadaceae bacterium]
MSHKSLEKRYWRRIMINLKKIFATISLISLLSLAALNTQAGILMTDDFAKNETTSQQCQETKTNTTGFESGIIVHLTGIIVHLTGIIVHASETEPNVDCGIIVH